MTIPTQAERAARNGAALHRNAPAGVLDLDALAAEVRAEAARPHWTTGPDHKDHLYAGLGTVLIDPEGVPAAFCVSSAVASALAEGMTVVARLEDEGAAAPASRADLDAANADRMTLAFENGVLREELDQARQARDGAEARLRFEHDRNAALRRRNRELDALNARLDAEIVNAGHDAVCGAVARQEAMGLLQQAMARLEDEA